MTLSNIHHIKIGSIILVFIFLALSVKAQIGTYRNDLSVGVNGGYIMSNVGFTPKVTQGMHGGITGGLSFRYVCEKYFNTICSIYGEVNYAQLGWKESILDIDNQPVINSITNAAEQYSRTINYVQLPILANLAWGKEVKGCQFFFRLGPQFGFCINESTHKNFDIVNANFDSRTNDIVAQDTMAVAKKFDYGIAVGAGLEYSTPKVGHFLIEGRYYYGLGNIFGDSKRDYFSKSNFGNIVIKMTYLFDITKTKR